MKLRTEVLIKNSKETYHQIDNKIAIKSENHDDVTYLRTCNLLYKKCISLSESSLVLVNNLKFIEAFMMLRSMYEINLLLQYFQIHNEEVKRWLIWDGIRVMDENGEDLKINKMPRKKVEFLLYLEICNFSFALESCKKCKNHMDIRNFSNNFLQKSITDEVKLKRYINDKEYYTSLCKAIHPSIKSIYHNDKKNDELEKQVYHYTLQSLLVLGDIISKIVEPFNDDMSIIAPFIGIE